jgi:D-arabinose 1-dehydrogenase-like Zn-dependent alcohol dehydrogenase
VLRPHVHTHALAEAPAILESMKRGEIAGRAVIAF